MSTSFGTGIKLSKKDTLLPVTGDQNLYHKNETLCYYELSTQTSTYDNSDAPISCQFKLAHRIIYSQVQVALYKWFTIYFLRQV